MIHNFDEFINRRGTDCKKYSEKVFDADVLPMWIADTDFKCPQPVLDALEARLSHGVMGYPTNEGEFNSAVCLWMKKRFGLEINESCVEYVSGIVTGIGYLLPLISEQGDKVLVQTPCYQPFRQVVEDNGRIIEENHLLIKDGKYEIDFESLDRQLSDSSVKVMILCNPHNPTGRCFRIDELKKIDELCKKHNVFVISDEIHSDIIFGDCRHIPYPMVSKENCVSFINPSKTFNIAGLRTAAMIIPDDKLHPLIRKRIMCTKGISQNIFGTVALVTAYKECDYYVEQLNEYIKGNINVVKEALKEMPKITFINPEATFLLWLDCRQLGLTQDELNNFFKNQAKLGLNNGESFGSDGVGFMRLNIACPRSLVVEAMSRLKKAYDEIA